MCCGQIEPYSNNLIIRDGIFAKKNDNNNSNTNNNSNGSQKHLAISLVTKAQMLTLGNR